MIWGLGALAELGADLSLTEALSAVAPYDVGLIGFGGELSKFVRELYANGYTAANTDSGSLSDAELASLVRNSAVIKDSTKKSMINSIDKLRGSNFFVHKAGSVETVIAKVSDPSGDPITKKLNQASALDLVLSAVGGVASGLTAQTAAKEVLKKQARGEPLYTPAKTSPLTIVYILSGVAVLGLVGYTLFTTRQGRK